MNIQDVSLRDLHAQSYIDRKMREKAETAMLWFFGSLVIVFACFVVLSILYYTK